MDFSQAYDDKVLRRILFEILRRIGCGSVMFCALSAMYHLTKYNRDCSGNHYSECATGITYIMFIIYHVFVINGRERDRESLFVDGLKWK